MKISFDSLTSKEVFVAKFNEYCLSNGWEYTGTNPFESLENPRVEKHLVLFGYTITEFDGDVIDLMNFFDDLPDNSLSIEDLSTDELLQHFKDAVCDKHYNPGQTDYNKSEWTLNELEREIERRLNN